MANPKSLYTDAEIHDIINRMISRGEPTTITDICRKLHVRRERIARLMHDHRPPRETKLTISLPEDIFEALAARTDDVAAAIASSVAGQVRAAKVKPRKAKKVAACTITADGETTKMSAGRRENVLSVLRSLYHNARAQYRANDGDLRQNLRLALAIETLYSAIAPVEFREAQGPLGTPRGLSDGDLQLIDDLTDAFYSETI